MASAALLSRQFKQMQSDKDIPGISCGLVNNNVYEWEVMLMISDDVKHYGGESVIVIPLHHLVLVGKNCLNGAQRRTHGDDVTLFCRPLSIAN